MKILIAEDDFVSRRLLQKILANWGHEVLIAENGHEAWEIFQKENPKLVIADWIMPVIDGVTLCRTIRSAPIQGYVYFILLTGKDKKEDLIEGLSSGADDYIIKPFDMEELHVRIRAGERILDLEKQLTEKNETLISLNRRLEELARMDFLMNIGNRRSFYEAIQKVHDRAMRYSHSYGIIMCDVDNFKSYNDSYGHISGDRLLQTVADTIKNTHRISDDIFRYGGEEIVLVLPEQDLRKTLGVAERLRYNIEALAVEHRASGRGILTISCGVAVFEKDSKNISWETILENADKALYVAKTAGKNKVCM